MDEPEDSNDAMAAMMGFSAFGSNKRHKPNPEKANRPPKPPTTSSNSAPLGIRTSKPAAEPTPHIASAQDTADQSQATESIPVNRQTQLNAAAAPFHSNTDQGKQTDRPDVGYTSPWTGATLTKAEVWEYARGKTVVDENGEKVTVFFKKSFVEDPWARLMGGKG